jgi:hypothetical protein
VSVTSIFCQSVSKVVIENTVDGEFEDPKKKKYPWTLFLINKGDPFNFRDIVD